VITTTANGFADIVKHSEQGSIVAAGDVSALSAGLDNCEASLTENTRAKIRSWAAEYSVKRNVQASLKFIEACSKL
jgi:glycosyltransferase involved in cell wall biosynthesis